MKRALALTLALLSAWGCEGNRVAVDAGQVAPSIAMLTKVEGGVVLSRKTKRMKAEVGPVFEGDLLETGPDGHAILTVAGFDVELLKLSRFRVGSSLAELDLAVGELSFENDSTSTYFTPVGAVRAEAGSQAKLQMNQGGAALEVTLGTLELLETDAGKNTLGKGERLVVSMGQLTVEEAPPPSKPVKRSKLKLKTQGTVRLQQPGHSPAAIPPEGIELDGPAQFVVDRAAQLTAEREGSTMQFEGTSKGALAPSEEQLSTSLTQGEARLFLGAGESAQIGGKRPVHLTAQEAATVWVTATKDGPRLEVLAGEVEAALDDGLPRKLGPADVATPKKKGFETQQRAPPVVSLPQGRSTRVYWAKPQEVSLQLGAGEQPIEVAADPQFRTLLVSGTQKESLRLPAPANGSLYWRRKGETDFSSARFARDDGALSAGAKTDTIAETGLKATVLFQSAVPTLTFSFSPKAGVSTWRFRVYATANLTAPLVDRKVNEPRTVVESGLLPEGTYVWSALALDPSGNEMPGGRMNKMDIVFDNSVTRLVLRSPKEGERASTAVGLVPRGSRLFLNGKAVSIDSAGRFSVGVGESPILVFRLVSKEGNESLWVRRIAR